MNEALRDMVRAQVTYGNFILASGKHSDIYIDLKKVTLTTAGMRLIGSLMLYELMKYDVQSVGGPSIGADPVVVATVYKAPNFRGWLVRAEVKDHGVQGSRIIGPIKRGDRVAILDDVATSGDSLRRAIEAAIEEYEVKVMVAGCILDREEGAREKMNVPFFSLLKMSDVRPKLL